MGSRMAVRSASSGPRRKKARKKGRQAGRKRRERGRDRERGGREGEEKRSPEAEREGVTTAALSITIFTTRGNLRDLNILCGGLAQALHNHSHESRSQSLGCIIMHGDGTA